MNKIELLIIGGTGFVGKSILRWLAETNQHVRYNITIFSRNSQNIEFILPEVIKTCRPKFINGNILKLDTFPSTRFELVIHAAAETANDISKDPLYNFDQIVYGTRNVLDWAARYKIGRLLYISSGATYGDHKDDRLISESCLKVGDPLLISSTYGIAKKTAEHLCALYSNHYGISVSIARCFSFLGPDLPLKKHFAIGNFIHDALYSSEIQIHGDGTAVRSYMDFRDMSRWLMCILEKGSDRTAYNVGSDHKITIKQLANLVMEILSPAKIVSTKGKDEIISRNYYVPDITLAKNELQLQLNISLSESIKYVGEYLCKEI